MNATSKQQSKSRFTPTSNMVLAAENVFKAMAFEQTVRPIVEAYQKAILAEGKWVVREEFARNLAQEVITDSKHSYLMSDADFAVYVTKCNVERDKAGLVVELDEQCPLLVAENILMQAKRGMMTVMSDITKIKEPSALPLKEYKKLVELTLQLLAPFIEKQNT